MFAGEDSVNRRAFLRPLLAGALGAALLPGCACAIGFVTYAVSGKVVKAGTGLPLAKAAIEVSAQEENAPPPPPEHRSTVMTNADRTFEVLVIVEPWGCTYALGFIPLNRPSPRTPRPAREVCLRVQPDKSSGQWVDIRIPVSPSQQLEAEPGQRRIDLA